jgi:DNA-binding IclR family transcriptional regulator
MDHRPNYDTLACNVSLPVPAAERTLLLLELLLKYPDGVTPQEFLTHLDISRSSLFTLLQTLKSLGYVEQFGSRGRYMAGPRLLSWRRAGAGEVTDLITAFYQETHRHSLGETSVLIVPNADESLILSQVESPHILRTSFEIGQSLHYEASTAAPLFIADPPEDIKVQAYHLRQTDEVVEIAVPICSDGFHPDAAVMLSAPSHRLSKEKALALLPILREIVTRMSYRLGAHTYQPFLTIQDKSPIGPPLPMSRLEIKEFLQGPWAARLACLRSDGTPHVVPIWYEFRAGCFYIAAWKDSLWANYLKGNPNTSLTIDEPWPPLRRIFARARAEPIEKDELPGGLFAFLNRLSSRYLSQSVEPALVEEEWHPFRLDPENLRGWRGLHLAI